MNKQHWPLRLACVIVALASAGSALASVDTSPKPGGVYKLKPGVYVAEGTACEQASNETVLSYDGRGLSSPHSGACTVRVRSQVRNRYTVEQSCSQGRRGRRQVERQQVAVDSALAFSQTIGGDSTSYRYCPVYQLPRAYRKGLR